MMTATTRRAALAAALAAFGVGSLAQMQDASAQRRIRPPDSDFDNDGVKNRVDRDDDNDGRPDWRDRDDDNDGIRDRRDRDDDNDGYRDREDPEGRKVRPGVRPPVQWQFRYRPFTYGDRHHDDLDAYDLGYGFDDEFMNHLEHDYWRFDRNGDRRLQLGERQAFWIHMARMGMFGPMSPAQAREMGFIAASLDTNGNGQLTRYELRRLTRFIKARQLFLAFDRNRDGRLMRRETRGWFTREFHALDLNGDRIVTRAEMRRALLGTPRRHYWGWSYR
ncbi:MAG TPA: hypothetical protein VFU21_23010 [Kofleriaceae bacterium]|nr:hypothetical protein [Kofleriaceae bacterium]